MVNLGARSRARELWDSVESNGLGLGTLKLDEPFETSGDARPIPSSAVGTNPGPTKGANDAARTSSAAPSYANRIPPMSAASRLADERRRLRELESQRRKNHVSRRKERRGLNVALLGHGLDALLEDNTGMPDREQTNTLSASVNPWRSTFRIPLPPSVVRLLNDHTGTILTKSDPSKERRGLAPYSMSLGQATTVLGNIGLRLSDLPPTREAWRLAPQAAKAWKPPRPGRQSEPSPTASLHRADVPAELSDTLYDLPPDPVGDFGPLQMGVIQMALDISQWSDLLDARGRGRGRGGLSSSPAVVMEEDPDATIQPASESSPDRAPETISDLPPNNVMPLRADSDEASRYAEVAKTPSYLLWHVPDSFGRLLVHAVARVYECGSFSADLPRWEGGILPEGQQAQQQRRPGPPRCTFIIHPYREGVGRKSDLVSSAIGKDLHGSDHARSSVNRKRAPSATSVASSAKLTTTSGADASSRSRSPGTSVTSAASEAYASEEDEDDVEVWGVEEQVHGGLAAATDEASQGEEERQHQAAPASRPRPRPTPVSRLTGVSTESELSGAESLSASEIEDA